MFMQKYEKQTYALLRIMTGFLFFWHGSQKLINFPPSGNEPALYIVVIAGTIEFIGGLLIMLGLFVRWTAFIASGEMAYAYWSTAALRDFLPIVNRGELAVLYCFVFLFFSAYGAGIWSIDNYINEHKSKKLEIKTAKDI